MRAPPLRVSKLEKYFVRSVIGNWSRDPPERSGMEPETKLYKLPRSSWSTRPEKYVGEINKRLINYGHRFQFWLSAFWAENIRRKFAFSNFIISMTKSWSTTKHLATKLYLEIYGQRDSFNFRFQLRKTLKTFKFNKIMQAAATKSRIQFSKQANKLMKLTHLLITRVTKIVIQMSKYMDIDNNFENFPFANCLRAVLSSFFAKFLYMDIFLARDLIT